MIKFIRVFIRYGIRLIFASSKQQMAKAMQKLIIASRVIA